MSIYEDEDYDTLWDEDFYEVLRQDAEQEAANRWLELWDRLEALGVVSSPEDGDITLRELERIVGYVK